LFKLDVVDCALLGKVCDYACDGAANYVVQAALRRLAIELEHKGSLLVSATTTASRTTSDNNRNNDDEDDEDDTALKGSSKSKGKGRDHDKALKKSDRDSIKTLTRLATQITKELSDEVNKNLYVDNKLIYLCLFKYYILTIYI